MFSEVHVNTSMEQEFSQTMSGLVKNTTGKREVSSKESWKNDTYNLMKQLAGKIMCRQTDKSMNGETKTELTEKTEFSMHESVYTLIRKKPKKRKENCINSQMLKQDTRFLHYSNICQMIKNNTTKLIRNKLTLHEKSRKIVRRRLYNRENSLVGKIESMEKLLSSWKKDFKKKTIVKDLKWSMKSTFKSFVMRNEIIKQQITPVPIVPPLPLPMWAKALDEPPQVVILRRTPENSFMRTRLIMRRRMRNASRKRRSCMIRSDSLAKALTSPKWSRGPRQVPVSVFQATRIHYRFLLAKYGKARLMGRHRVYPNSIKSNIHSNFSVINLLHEVEEAMSHNKYSKETDKLVKNFKDELNKDLLYNEPINRKYHKFQISNANNFNVRKKGKSAKPSGEITLSELVEQLGGNESEDSYHDIESDRGVSPEKSQGKKFFLKEKKYIKKKKVSMKELKTETISEEERLSAILLELQKQVKTSELNTSLFLAKNDSLTELNFETEPRSYISMHGSTTTINSGSTWSQMESTNQQEARTAELSEHETNQSLLSPSEPMLPIEKNKPLESEQSSTKLYSFRINCESIKNKSKSIYNIITAFNRINKVLQNIPIQYDKNTGRPYIVYDPRTIVKVIKEVNIKHEYKMVMKKHNNKSKIYPGNDKSYSDTCVFKTKNAGTMAIEDEKCLEVGNQSLKSIFNLMEQSNINECICPIEDKEYEKSSLSIDSENSSCCCDRSLVHRTVGNPNIVPTGQLGNSIGLLKLPDTKIETIRYKKRYFEQVIKTAITNHITGVYHQAIIYTERQEYFAIFQPKVSQKVLKTNKKTNELNRNTLSSTAYAELKEKYTDEFRERCKNIPNELSKKYDRRFTNEINNQAQMNISQKYYQQYNKTRKLLLSKYEFNRNIKKESVENDLYKPCLETDLGETLDSNGSFINEDSSSIINKPGNTIQVIHAPKISHIEKSHIIDGKSYETKKDAEVIPSLKYAKNKNDLNIGQTSPHFNALISSYNTEQAITNKNNHYKELGGFPLNKSIMNNILRSVSINTIPNTYRIRKEMTKHVFYFQTTYPLIENLEYFYKKRPSQGLFKPSEHDRFSKYIYCKENSKLETYKSDINRQIMDSVNTIKNDLNKNINNICQIMNLDTNLLVKFLKICLKQNELDFKEDKKLPILEKEMEELKSLMEKRLGKKTNPLRLIQKKQKGPNVRGHQKIIEFKNGSKIKQSILTNKVNVQGININRILNNSKLYTKILRILNVLVLIFSLISFLN